MNQEEMDKILAREKYLRDRGMLPDEIMGDYSLNEHGKRKHNSCYCGDCKFWDSPRNKKEKAYYIEGKCQHPEVEVQPKFGAFTGHNCPHFQVRHHDTKKKKSAR